MASIYHHSREELYRAPLGARPCDALVTLRLRAGRSVRRATLRLWWEGAETRHPMLPVHGGFFEYTLRLPGKIGLLWYYFIVEMLDGSTCYYGNALDKKGGEGHVYQEEPPSYQITLYDPEYKTPEWMREGVMYQIMVDRFFAARPAAEKGAPPQGHYHLDWHEPPENNLDDPYGDNVADDFFGGDLLGVAQKLPYLRDLGVTALYLNPIFRAKSNHKYDTGDYEMVDPAFGGNEDFQFLCQEAEKAGIRVVLDGVFSHTGSDSKYFNRFGRYEEVGAYQSQQSPYYPWYTFRHWPDDYECWWDFGTLPNVSEMSESYLDYMVRGPQAICAKWPRLGSSGWRLDVADELPMDFIRAFRERLKKERSGAALIGEVWEDCSNKVAYGQVRSYCLGDALDSAMNYPLRDLLIDFLLEKTSAAAFCRGLEYLQEVYPAPFFYSLMNLLGSHDRPRAISALSGAGEMAPPRPQRSAKKLRSDQYALGRRRFLAAWRAVCALPGMPCLYYGDEAGAQGMADPFCRGTYPWGREDRALLREVRDAIHQRCEAPVLRTGQLRLYAPCPDVVVIARRIEGGRDVFGKRRKDAFCAFALNRADAPRRVALESDGFLRWPIDAEVPPIACVLLAARSAR